MDIFSYLLGKKAGGGGGEAVLINKNIDANGTYNASSDNADGYRKVEVAVPNSYAAGDEGKVVSNGALVTQGSDTVTENDTYDTTLIKSLTVNVSGGGSSIQSGTYTPAENELNPVFNVGASFTNFLIWTDSATTGHSVRAFTGAYVDFTDANGIVRIAVSTNNAGSAYSAVPVSSNGGNYIYTKSGNVVTVEHNASSGNYPGYFLSGVTYNWIAW